MKDWKMMLKEKNVGSMDQKIRLAAGIALAFVYLTGMGSPIILIAAALLIVTGARRSCPAYSMMKYSSAKTAMKEKDKTLN